MAANDDGEEILSRRQFIELTSIASVTALAGCAGSNDSPTTGEDGVVDQEFVAPQLNAPPTDGHYNAVSGHSNYHAYPSRLLYDPLVQYNLATGEFVKYAISDWEITDTEVTLRIRDGLTWHDGDPVTARDLLTQFRLAKKMESTLWDYAKSVERVDDSTVRINLEGPTNPDIIKFTLSGMRVAAKHSEYGKYLDKDAAALQEFDDVDPIGTGPFEFESHDQQQQVFTRFEDHPDVGNITFTTYKHLFKQSNSAVHQGLLSKELDGGANFFTPPKVVENLPNAVKEVRLPANHGYGIVCNHEHKHLGKRAVRQAIAYAMDRTAIKKNAGPRTKQVPEKITGITSAQQNKWLGNKIGEFSSYGPGSKPNKATKLLTGAGYSKNGGTWTDGGGSAIKLPYMTPAGWSDWTVATKAVVDQLNNFGFDASVKTTPAGEMMGSYGNNDFVIGAMYWAPGGARSAFPYYGLHFQLYQPWTGPDAFYPEGEVTIPALGESGKATINPHERLSSIPTTTDNEKLKTTIQELAWHANVELPAIQVLEKYNQSWLTNDSWKIPDPSSDAAQVEFPCYWSPRIGDLQAISN